MNQIIQQLVGEFKEKFEDGTGITMCCECGIDIEKLKFFLVQSLTTAYQTGQDDLKKKLLEEIPKEWKYEKNIGGSGSIGFNECREQIIKLIESI